MEEQSYYLFPRSEMCNRKSTEKPLMVNCTGCQYCRRKFDNNNRVGRKDYYLQYLIDGELTVCPDNEILPFKKGDFIIWESEKPFRYGNTNPNTQKYLWIHFTGFHAARLISDLGLTMGKLYHTNPTEKKKEYILDLFRGLFDEFSNRRPGMEEACTGFLTNILVSLMRETEKVSIGKKRKLITVSYLHTHYKENTSVNELAAMEHLSVSRYREVFRRHTGLSPVDYRTAIRLGNACRLLLQTDLTVEEIASDCGYSDVFFFIRIFKKKNGMTPGKYRACGGILQGKGTV